MKKLSITIITFFLLSGLNTIFGQVNVREDFLDAEFFLSEEDYREALFSYQKVYKAGYQDNANINYRIGMCYLNIPGEKESSIPYLEKAVTGISKKWSEGSFKETAAPPDAYLYLANAYRISYKLDEAISTYNKYVETLDASRIQDIEFTKQQIRSCEKAKLAIKEPVSLLKENLGRKFNTNMDNSHVVFSGDRNSMAFMSQLRFYDGIFFSRKINNNWSNTINITPQIESDGDQFVSSLSFNGQKMYLVKVGNFDADIYESDFASGRWLPSKSIGKPVNTKYFESHASTSPDGNTLYFTSNRKESLGGMDIFFSTRNEKGTWSEPFNLGSTVNTALNEETPFIHTDGKTLYFSSQGHETIGGYDIFKTVKQADGSWSTPEPLPYPVNTTDDDLFFFPSDKENSGYLTLYQPDGLGSGDLYYVELLPASVAKSEAEKLVIEKVIKDTVKEISQKPITEPEKKPVKEIITPVPSVKYIIKPIFFDFDSYALSATSKSKLDEIAKALNAYPGLTLEVRGYADALGSFEYNQSLSEKRSKSVIDYLVSKNLSGKRLVSKGLSESENVAINRFPDGRDAAEGRKLNRRVEFRIITEGGALIIIEEVKVPESLRIK